MSQHKFNSINSCRIGLGGDNLMDSKELVIRGIIDEEKALDISNIDFEDKKDILLSQIISPHNHPFLEDAEKLILSFYYDVFYKKQRIPSIDDILTKVMNYNWEILRKISEIDFYVNHFNESGYWLSKEEIEYCIAQLADELLGMYYYDFFAENEEFVADILDNKKLCYEYSSEHFLYQYFSRPDDNFKIYKNDSQTIMFEGVVIEQMKFALEEMTEDEILKINIVSC